MASNNLICMMAPLRLLSIRSAKMLPLLIHKDVDCSLVTKRGGRASVSVLLVEMIEKNRRKLDLELGKTVR